MEHFHSLREKNSVLGLAWSGALVDLNNFQMMWS